MRDQSCLGDAELAALLDVARVVERHFGGHQDVEWAFARGQPRPDALVVLQARPVTTLPDPAPKLSSSALSLVMSTFGASGDAQERS
jgi:phosphoenolpyruvate synthase/pyruvate phosphate dikinase